MQPENELPVHQPGQSTEFKISEPDLNKSQKGSRYKKIKNDSSIKSDKDLFNKNLNESLDSAKPIKQLHHVQINPKISLREAHIRIPTETEQQTPRHQPPLLQNPQAIYAAEITQQIHTAEITNLSSLSSLPSPPSQEHMDDTHEVATDQLDFHNLDSLDIAKSAEKLPEQSISVPLTTVFPKLLSSIKLVNAFQEGSTGAELVESEGVKYAKKSGANAGHIVAENQANRTYKVLEVSVPEVALPSDLLSANKAAPTLGTKQPPLPQIPVTSSAALGTKQPPLPQIPVGTGQPPLPQIPVGTRPPPLPQIPVTSLPVVSPADMPIQSAALSLPPQVYTGEQYEKAAIKATTANTDKRTALHQLFDKAAEAYINEGRIEDAFRVRAMLANELKMPSTHPLHKMNAAIDQKVAQQEGKAKEFGAHFSGLDTGVVKGGNIRINRRNIEGEQKDVMEFRMSQFARRDLQANLYLIENNLTAFIDSLPPELKTQVTTTEIPYSFKKEKDGVFSDAQGYQPGNAKAIQIEFKGIGKVIIGKKPSYGCMYNNVSVEIDANLPDGQGLDRMHQMLSVLGCGPILAEKRPQDDERMRFAVILHNIFPQEAVQLERTKEFYEIPLKELKNQVFTFLESKYGLDNIKAVFDKYEQPGMMEKVEIYPGKTVWALNDLGDQMRSRGAKGLMMGVSNPKNIGDMLTYGCLSTQDRMQAGIMHEGASSRRDLKMSGGDTVFTRLINEHTIKTEINEFDFSYDVQLLVDCDACNQGAYGSDADYFGVKNPHFADDYKNYTSRPNLENFAASTTYYTNEVMIKNRIIPEHFRGVVVANDKIYNEVLNDLIDRGLVELRGNEQYINGKPVDQFIHIRPQDRKFRETMWAPPEA